ncbi:hypothetical protein Rcae01_03775 [Novipirellula caenicola]|uniref:Uncharacterized protein n=1 Tax=Novipirellula caenicola TaxID=1536901 RepID=A0ABP9VT37_9BACT
MLLVPPNEGCSKRFDILGGLDINHVSHVAIDAPASVWAVQVVVSLLPPSPKIEVMPPFPAGTLSRNR